MMWCNWITCVLDNVAYANNNLQQSLVFVRNLCVFSFAKKIAIKSLMSRFFTTAKKKMPSFYAMSLYSSSVCGHEIVRESFLMLFRQSKCLFTRFVDPPPPFFFNFFNSSLVWDIFIINTYSRGSRVFVFFRNRLISISDWVFGNVWSCSTLFIMKTSHKSDELKK
jgi:hypothetical protein